MEVILLERIETLGQMGDVVKVKPGYARNFLLPQQKALRANKANMALFETQRAQLEADNLKRRDEAEAVAAKLEGLSTVLIRQAGESGQLYGSVTARDLGGNTGEVPLPGHVHAADDRVGLAVPRAVAIGADPRGRPGALVSGASRDFGPCPGFLNCTYI